MESPMDQRFDLARFFVLYTLETGQWSAHGNKQNTEAAQRAGTQAAQRIAGLGASAVITGHCGPKAFAALGAAGIEVYQQASGTVQEAVDAYKETLLSKSIRTDVEAESGGA